MNEEQEQHNKESETKNQLATKIITGKRKSIKIKNNNTIEWKTIKQQFKTQKPRNKNHY